MQLHKHLLETTDLLNNQTNTKPQSRHPHTSQQLNTSFPLMFLQRSTFQSMEQIRQARTSQTLLVGANAHALTKQASSSWRVWHYHSEGLLGRLGQWILSLLFNKWPVSCFRSFSNHRPWRFSSKILWWGWMLDSHGISKKEIVTRLFHNYYGKLKWISVVGAWCSRNPIIWLLW